MRAKQISERAPSVPEIAQALQQGVDEGVFPGAAAAVFLRGKLIHASVAGDAQRIPARIPLPDDAVFDLASVTKVVATTTAAVALVARGALSLDDSVARFWPGFARAGKRSVTIRHLLAHSSGLPAWKPMFLDVAADPGGQPLFAAERDPEKCAYACRRGRAIVFDAIEAAELEQPPGTKAVYSDLGFIALGRVIEEVSGQRLDAFVERDILPELRLESLMFRPLDRAPRKAPVIAATGVYRPNEPAPGQEQLVPAPPPDAAPRDLSGEVNDDNAFAMGGVAGHAGLFGNARDVAAWGNAVIEELSGAMRIAPPEVWERFCTLDSTPGTSRALGFDTPTPGASSAGRYIASSRAVGHLGFTGTSVWIDLRRQLSVALLTNRVHPTRANLAIREFRPRFHDTVIEAFGLEGVPE
ncbi:MAG: serine hydrolase domain-containing protein [Myxococcales bacterium]|jgi:CubicO group peptidase (beta-lactamase class C family)